jgi:hypothetical protein
MPWTRMVPALVMLLAVLGVPAPASAADPKVVLVGDMACATYDTAYDGGEGEGQRCRQKATSDLALSSSVTAVVTLGDNQYEKGELGQFRESYDASWGRVKSKTYPTCGNHEYKASSTAYGFREYFGRTCSVRKVTIGSWDWILLDTNKSLSSSSTQYAKVKSYLTNSTKRCIGIVGHHPRYSSGPHGNDYDRMDKVWDLAHDQGVTVFASGHDHSYQRYDPRNKYSKTTSTGMVQLISGAGGKNITGIDGTPSSALERYVGVPGVLELTLGSDRATGAYRGIDGEVHDSFTLRCRRP